MRTFLSIGLMLIFPILLMLGVFRLGSTLNTTPDVKGEWRLQFDAPDECAPEPLTNLTITQSGMYLMLHFQGEQGITLKGKLTLEGNVTAQNEKMIIDTTLMNHSGMVGELYLKSCDQSFYAELIRVIP